MKQYGIWLLAPFILTACDNSSQTKITLTPELDTQHNTELQILLRQIKENLVFVEGGSFLMGDFGAKFGQEKILLDTQKDSKPLH